MDLYSDWLSDLPQQFQDKERIGILIRAISKQMEQLYQVYTDLDNKTDLEDACGKNLDYVGAIINLSRKQAGILAGINDGEPVITDERYREFLRYKILLNTCDGTYYDLMDGMKFCCNEPVRYVEDPLYPATIIFETQAKDLDEPDNLLFRSNLCIRPSGVDVTLIKRYFDSFRVPIKYENIITFQTEFYPQHNLPPHLLEGEHFLDGGKVLNGYAIDQTVDLYPVNLKILSEINQPIIVATTLGIQTDTVVGGKLDASLNLEAEANEGIVEEVSLNLQCSGEVVGSGAAELTVEDHLRYLDGNGTLNGEGYLNADIYHFVL